MIVGFPGETEEEFETTKTFLDKVNFYETHIFQYSRRKGTRAAAMEDQVPAPIQHERSACLIAAGRIRQQAFESELCGKETEVLFEESVLIEGKRYVSGHTKEYVRLLLETGECLENELVPVSVLEERRGGILLCELTISGSGL